MKRIDITVKIVLTLSKIMGSLVILAGLYGFIKDIGSSEFLVLTGAGMIGYKQYLTSKDIKHE